MTYEPDTGLFRCINAHGNLPANRIAGRQDAKGYIRVGAFGRQYPAHRLAWFYMTGEWPPLFIDHINGQRDDNRWANLRPATDVINKQNIRLDSHKNQIGLLGVSYLRRDRTSRFRAVIRSGGKQIHLGSFTTAEEAHAAYIKAKRALHEGNTL